ncbi:MAG: 16S rRNA (cytosine(967)-C(5))-methyltransferase RsmB [Syntrophales bacterium]
MKGANPRRIAVDILNRVDEDGAYAEPLLDAALSGGGFGTPADRGLLTELVYGTLRMQGRLDWVIAALYRGDATALDRAVLNILRTGLYQLQFTDRIPPFAAVNEAVAITRGLVPAAAGLVNAVLRTFLRRGGAIAWPEMAKHPAQAIAVLHSHPRWLVERLLAHTGAEEAVAICRANNAVPPTALRINTLKTTLDAAIAALGAEGMTATKTRFSPDGVILASASAALRQSAAYRSGLVRIQDEASQLIARLVAPAPGEQILDLCAGSGGKTLHLAALMENRGSVTAVDLQPRRLAMLRTEAERLGVTIVQTRAGDAAAAIEPFREVFDRVLLDAPCSGLGTLRRNPEIRWRVTPADVNRCAELQHALLARAAGYVRPGGLIVYSVCTVTPEENEAVIGAFLQLHADFTVLPLATVSPALLDGAGYFRSAPHLHGTDGFFAAVLLRTA